MNLLDQIVEILTKRSQAMRIPEIELELKHAGNWVVDTFDIRDAVTKLIDLDRAREVHPGRLIELTRTK